jgi:hypothetical protein
MSPPDPAEEFVFLLARQERLLGAYMMTMAPHPQGHAPSCPGRAGDRRLAIAPRRPDAPAMRPTLALLFALFLPHLSAQETLTLARDGHWLVVRGAHLPGGEIRTNYLEAYCRAGSTDADWGQHTVIKHTSEFLSLSADAKVLRLRYTPGQVWCPKHVPRTDVNPRPLSALVPSHGLIGCFSGDEQWIWATAWEPYQELFQGIARCLHSDFRLGGLAPGETKTIRGKMYLVRADVPALLQRYARDFPEH